nr:type II secretion system F family protein [Pseudomonadota bacterium]
RLRRRIDRIVDEFDQPGAASLLRDKYLQTLSPLERWLEALPGMAALGRMIDQAGYSARAWHYVLLAAALGAPALAAGWVFTHHPLIALAAGLAAAALPFFALARARARRLDRIEEQLPEALDIMTRALRAGHPFNETLHLVAEEMQGPIAREFGDTFADINYGADVRSAFLALLERVPSITLMTIVTSVLVQRETGGNLAEILEKNSAVVRGRFRFQRRVRTLSAEGRLSAWVLTMVPFVLFLMLSVVNPDYLPVLTRDPFGRQLIAGAFFMMIVGIFWMRKIIRIDV